MHLAACTARSLGENLALVGDHERVLLAAHDLDPVHARQRHHVGGRRDLRHWAVHRRRARSPHGMVYARNARNHRAKPVR